MLDQVITNSHLKKGVYSNITGVGKLDNLSVKAVVTANIFAGSGEKLTKVPAGQLTGTIAMARLGATGDSAGKFLNEAGDFVALGNASKDKRGIVKLYKDIGNQEDGAPTFT